MVKELNVYLRAARELTQKLDHEPSAEEIAELLDKPVDDVKRMLGLNERVASVDTPLGHDLGKIPARYHSRFAGLRPGRTAAGRRHACQYR